MSKLGLKNQYGEQSFNDVTSADENFAKEVVGTLVDGIELIETADVAAAGAAYDQEYADTVADLLNEVKAKVNQLIEALQGE